MSLIPNISPRTRALYVVVGIGLLVAAWLGPFTGRALPLVVAGLGLVSIVEGMIGF
jgi:hypothetical protein